MTHKTAHFTLIELIIVMVAALIVLLPIATMMGAIVGDWHTSRDIKLLQEEVDLASYSVKGLIEEAYYFENENGFPDSNITLRGANGQTVEIYQDEDGKELKIRSDSGEYAVIDRLTDSGLTFYDTDEEDENLPPGLIRVKITAERADRTHTNEFKVKLRNW